MTSGIYIIHNTKTGKVYIGQAQDIRWRWKTHVSQLRANNHANYHLQAAWNKYGEKSFQFKILERCSTDLLNEREQHFLNVYVAKGICYNIRKTVEVKPRAGDGTKKTKATYGLMAVHMRGDKAFVATLKDRAKRANMPLADYLRYLLDMDTSKSGTQS